MATGDLTRSISVEAEGEVAELKDNINAMVQSLRETTKANQEQYWLKTNLARFAGLLQGQRDLETVAELIMNELIPLVGAQHGTFFIADDSDDGRVLRLIAGLRAAGRHSGAQPVPAGPVTDRPGGQDPQADRRHRRPARLRADLLRPGRRPRRST